jgi:glutamate synthase (NADPH/NADH) small chain
MGEGAHFRCCSSIDSSFGASGLMGKITGFLDIERHDRKYEPVAERVKSYREFVVPLS